MKPRQFLIRNSERGIRNYGVLLRWNILMMGRLSGLPIFILTNYNLALHGNYCVSNWFSLPFAYKRKWEREGKALTLRAPVRILRTECGYSARRRAVKTFKSAKGVWVGETNEVCLRNVRVFPHKQHIVFIEPFLRNSPADCFGRTLHI